VSASGQEKTMRIQLQIYSFAKQSLSPAIIVDSFKTALFVGFILNMINNGDIYYNDADISGPNVLLNFIVPFLVSTYSGCRAAHLAYVTTLKKTAADITD
jgi:hypothetical protein